MIAFASNSLLCRLALRNTAIDPATFTSVRILSGAVTLWLVTRLWRNKGSREGNWLSGLALFAYAAAFSFAYITLSAGTGALLLFGTVQATMILWGLIKGERLGPGQICGLIVAVAGLIVLVLPGIAAPPLIGSLLMVSAGLAWGIYSVRGKGTRNPTSATAGNFIWAVPFALVLSLLLLKSTKLDSLGITYALVSGAVTSGLGYIVWYAVLPHLSAAGAACVQLSVPVLAAAGGILLLGEAPTFRFFVASAAILGGIALLIANSNRLRKA